MRKNLHYKVLASVLAIAGLYFYNAPAAWADIIYDAYQVKGDGTETITINNSQIHIDGTLEQLDNTFNIYGNYQDSGNANGDGNTINVTIQNSNLSSIYGGFSGSDNANKNIVHIDKSTAINVFGGYANSNSNSGNANKNKVTIKNNSTINDVYGGHSISGSANYNTVIIEDSTVTNHYFPKTNAVITGGYAVNHKNLTTVSATNNTVKLIGSTNVENADIYGGRTDNGNIDVTTGNKLILENWSGSVKSVQNFSDIYLNNITWQTDNPVLNITANTVTNALANTNINLNSLNFTGGTELNEGESMTFVNGENLGLQEDKVKINNEFTAGVATVGSGMIEVANDNNSIKYTLTEVKTNKQIDLVAENRAVAAAFVNQGTDLISDSLDTLSHDANYGVKTFAAVHGNRSKYDVNSDLKINGWSTIVGVGNAAEFADDDEFSWGVFYENGSGNYRTFNEFNNEFFRGDGSLVYNGGGIAARYENASGVYTEGSLRAGMLKSEMDNALHDGSGNYYGYDSESAYYGAHIGVGKIISLSDSSDLDVYGKFFHTYTEGDSFTVAKDKFEFDSITSDRLRIGARVTTNKENAFSTYYGLAYEYEFNGDADMRAQNLKAPTQSLQGSSYMAEVGFNYQPAPDSPWSFDLNMRGYAGEREGASFNVQATYTF